MADDAKPFTLMRCLYVVFLCHLGVFHGGHRTRVRRPFPSNTWSSNCSDGWEWTFTWLSWPS